MQGVFVVVATRPDSERIISGAMAKAATPFAWQAAAALVPLSEQAYGRDFETEHRDRSCRHCLGTTQRTID